MSDPEPTALYIGSVARLAAVFDMGPDDIGRFEPIGPDDLPTDYRTLLAHTGHMTVTLEAFHNSLVNVRVLRAKSNNGSYTREIVLTRRSDGGVVQYGLMRVWLADLPEDVRQEITSQEAPLGRVLIRHGLLREVELLSLWRVTPSDRVRTQLAATADEALYGRSAQILVDHRPTVQLLEIVKV